MKKEELELKTKELKYGGVITNFEISAIKQLASTNKYKARMVVDVILEGYGDFGIELNCASTKDFAEALHDNLVGLWDGEDKEWLIF